MILIDAFLNKIFYNLAILAGELKHGPLGLVDGGAPVLAVVTKDATYQVCLNVLSNVPYHICSLSPVIFNAYVSIYYFYLCRNVPVYFNK